MKAATTNFIKSLAKQLGPKGIRVISQGHRRKEVTYVADGVHPNAEECRLEAENEWPASIRSFRTRINYNEQ